MISERVTKIGVSPTLKTAAKAMAMKAEGIDVIDLSVGEPDFPTPEAVKEAGIKAIRQDFTKYTQNNGIPDLRKAILKRLKEDHGLTYGMNEVIVSSGAKSSLYHLIQAIVDDGDEVIIPAPYWVTYPECVVLAKGKPVVVPTREEDGFLLTPGALASSISQATKAVILNNPGNPTGAAYDRKQLEALAEVIKAEDITVVADEIYGKLLYDGASFTSFASLGEDVRKKTVIINGVSKAYSMTGWRIGYAAGPAEIIGGMSKIQSHTTSNACSVSQKASVEAFGGPQHEVQRMAAEFQRRRNYCLMKLQAIAGLRCFKPQGAFYLFPNVKAFYGKEAGGIVIRNSYGMAYYLLKQARVAVVAGDAFGADDHIRISYSTSMENLEKGMARIGEALAALKSARPAKRVFLSNTVTRARKSVPVEAAVDGRMRDALVAEMESHLGAGALYEWTANIGGVLVQLRTNVSHLYDFWVENWHPGQVEADLEPHGVIYAVDGIAGREPRAYYSSETKTGVLVNTDNYAPLRSLALGLVMDFAGRMFGAHAIRGMAADLAGNGLVLVGPKGTNKTELFFGLLKDGRFRIQANDVVFVRAGAGSATADCVERKFYIPTNSVEAFDKLAPLFDRSKCENVVVKKEDCRDEECLRGEDCRLDRGSPYCYKASPEGHALLDPGWIGGKAAVVRRTNLRWMFLLRNDATSPAVVKLDKAEALRILEAGESAGAKKTAGGDKTPPFFNPHTLVATPERIELEKAFYSRLLDVATCYLFNSGVAGVDEIKGTLGL
ncbi:MAG: Aspartate/methionine/tyrosine aminotransferase [Candidatus Aminicenantes bacterium]|nr:Aspartate/methionine/tyrosine aminotransferase [Candidatus Aminicenantes bacterium]